MVAYHWAAFVGSVRLRLSSNRRKPPAFRHGDESRVARKGHDSTGRLPLSRLSGRIVCMEQQSIRKTYQYKLKPTPEQERVLERILMLCRHVYNAAMDERRKRGGCAASASPTTSRRPNCPASKKRCRSMREVHSQVLQDVVLRVERAFQAFFRRVKNGGTPGYPRFHGRSRYNSFTYPQVGEWRARWTTVSSSSPRLAGLPCAGHARWKARPRPSPSAGKRTAGMSASPAPMCQYSRFPPTGQETGIDLGIEAFATLSDGTRIFSSRLVSQSRARAQNRPTAGDPPQEGQQSPEESDDVLAKAHQTVRRQRQDFHHKTALALGSRNDTIYHENLQTRQHGEEPPSGQVASVTRGGRVPHHPDAQGSMRRSAGLSGSILRSPVRLLWLWGRGPERLIRPLA